MRLLSFSALAACALLVASCSGNKDKADDATVFVPIDYTLTVTNIENADSSYAYLYDYDALTSTRTPNADALIDSALVAGNQVVFNVKGSSAPVAILYFGNDRRIIFPEAGENTFNVADKVGSGELAKKYQAYSDSLNAVYSGFEKAPERGTPEYEHFVDSIQNLSQKITDDAMESNLNNAFGFFIATSVIGQDNEIVDSIVAKAPYLANSKRVQRAIEANERLKATSVGQPYTDFTIESPANGKTVKLSDFVKPGRYTLVDFWASWCGPCKRAIKGLKENYADLNAKGLDIVGVAVWEDPADTEKWLEENPLPWQIILDAQRVPTDIYAVSGIPTLVLIGPDGKIIARSYSDEEILEAFNAAITPAE